MCYSNIDNGVDILKKTIDIKFVFLLIFSISFLILFFGILYFYKLGDSNQIKLTSATNCFIENRVPISDSVALSIDINELDNSAVSETQIQLESFSDINDTFEYELILIEKNTDMRINGNFVKICLFDEEGNILNYISNSEIPTYSDLKISSTFAFARRVYVGKIKGNEIKNFRLRIWLADDYFVGSDLRSFEVKVGANVVR